MTFWHLQVQSLLEPEANNPTSKRPRRSPSTGSSAQGHTSYQPVYDTILTRDVADKINWDADSTTLELQIIPGLWEVSRAWG